MKMQISCTTNFEKL